MLQANTGVHEASDLLQTFFFFFDASIPVLLQKQVF